MSVAVLMNECHGRHDLPKYVPSLVLIESVPGHDVVKELSVGAVLQQCTWRGSNNITLHSQPI